VDLSQAQPWRLTGLISEDEISLGVGILGMPGATAYGGLMDVLRPVEGQTLWVSGAAGAVGGLVGQLGKIHGLRVVGSAGGDAKCSLITEKFGMDFAVDYKKTKDGVELIAALKEVVPDGIDMYFE
jgi:NADPH-dependent curcumin reductase CurA